MKSEILNALLVGCATDNVAKMASARSALKSGELTSEERYSFFSEVHSLLEKKNFTRGEEEALRSVFFYSCPRILEDLFHREVGRDASNLIFNVLEPREVAGMLNRLRTAARDKVFNSLSKVNRDETVHYMDGTYCMSI